ncbi:MAG: hypothetical protein QOH49_498 [Acidobacteriota bacterium]|nr:hypothetical protein [Acidobacteriota bacterium]
MALQTRTRTPRVSEIPIKVKSFIGDHKEIMNLSTASGQPQAQIARELIAEALKARRMKGIGKDEMSREVVAVQKKAMQESQEGVREKLDEILVKLERLDGRVHMADCRAADEFERLHDQGRFLSLALRFVVTEVIIMRRLLRDYVYVVYKSLIEKIGKPVNEIQQNFEIRVLRHRKAAEATPDELTELSVGRLHEMAGGKGTMED